MTAPLVFVLPLPVNLGNSRMHWAKRMLNKRAYWQALDVGVMAKRIPRPPAGGPFKRAGLAATIYHTHDTDADNREARLKFAIDWLVSRGYIVDDSDEHLGRAEICQVVKCRKVSERRLVLTLTPLVEAA